MTVNQSHGTVVLCFITLLAFGGQSQAEIIYSDNLIHTFNTAGFPSIHATNSTTLVVQSGAGINASFAESSGVRLDNTSSASISGGVVNGASNSVQVGDSAVVNISGGNFSSHFKGLYVNGSGTANVTGGTFYADGIGLGIQIQQNGTVNLQNGQFTGTWNGIEMVNSSVLNISGGTIHAVSFDAITVRNNSIANIYGGMFLVDGGGAGIDVRDQAMANVYGSGFNLPLGLVSQTSGILTGVYSNGTPFSTKFDQSDAPGMTNHINLVYAPVPEPSGFALGLIGVLGLFVVASKAAIARRSAKTP